MRAEAAYADGPATVLLTRLIDRTFMRLLQSHANKSNHLDIARTPVDRARSPPHAPCMALEGWVGKNDHKDQDLDQDQEKEVWRLRCLYRQAARPKDIAALLSNLGGGRLSSSVQRVLLHCLSDDPLLAEDSKQYRYEGCASRLSPSAVLHKPPCRASSSFGARAGALSGP